MEMESSEPISSSLSLSSPHSTPRKSSLSTSLSIRAPLSLDDDDDSDSVRSFVSLGVSEFECNDDEDFDDDRTFVEFCDERSVVSEESVGSGLSRVFIRPFAQLSWDHDGDFGDRDCGDFGESESVVRGVDVVEKISVAPRVKGFGNGFWCDREESDENVVFGVLEECEEFGLEVLGSNEECFVENNSVQGSGFGEFCAENAKVEECDVGVLEDCDFEESSASNEGKFVGKSLIHDSGFDKFYVENAKIEEYDVGVLEACKPLASNEEGFVEISCVGFDKLCVENGIVEEYDVGVLEDCEGSCTEACDYEEPLALDEEDFAEKNPIQYLGFDKFCIKNPTVEEYDSGVEFDALESSRIESDLSGFPLSEIVEDLVRESSEPTEEIVSKTDQNKIEKMRLLRVKFLKLVHRIGISVKDPKVTSVLEKMTCDFPKQTSHFGTIESAKKKALEECEAENQTDLDLSLNILVLGKSGVGKSATINLIFGEKKSVVNAFEPATTLMQEIIGTINGVRIRILDTPGLKVHLSEQSSNRKLLANIHMRLRKFQPDIVLYVDRLDTETTEIDKPMLKTITASLGSSIWKNAIVTLTHSSSVRSRSHGIFAARKKLHNLRDSIGEANLLDQNLLCPVSLVENHPLISEGSNGRSNLLLLCYSMKVLSEANFVSRPKRVLNWKEILGFAMRSLLTSFLHLNLHKNGKPNNLESEDDTLTFLDSSNLGVQAVRDQISCGPRNGFKTNIRLDIASRAENSFNGFEIKDPITTMYKPNFEAPNDDESPLTGLGFMVKCRADLALSAILFLQAQFAIGRRGTNVLTGLESNRKRHSRIVVGVVGSDRLHIALIWVLQFVIPFFLNNH